METPIFLVASSFFSERSWKNCGYLAQCFTDGRVGAQLLNNGWRTNAKRVFQLQVSNFNVRIAGTLFDLEFIRRGLCSGFELTGGMQDMCLFYVLFFFL